MTTPRPYATIWLTYNAEIRSGVYGEVKRIETVRRRAFYSDSDGYYNKQNEWINTPNGMYQVPQFWSNFTLSDGSVIIVPHTFHSFGRVMPENIISWEYDQTERL